MPSTFHENMAGNFSDLIRDWLHDVRKGEHCKVDSTKQNTINVAGKIRSSLAARVKCSEPRDDQLEPDLSYTCDDCTVADLLVEVAWSQSNLQLPGRAKRYIEGKNGEIRTVVGLDMNNIYRGGCKATFSIWKARFIDGRWRCTMAAENQVRYFGIIKGQSVIEVMLTNQKFLDENGQAIKDRTLSLSLKDFICEEEERELGDFEDVPLDIPSTQLYDLYKLSFRKHVMAKAEEEMVQVTKKANDTLAKILNVKKMMQGQRTKDLGNRTVIGNEELAGVKNTISEVGRHIDEMDNTMKDIKGKLDRVDGRVAKVERKRVEFEKRMAEVKREMVEVRTEEKKIVGAEEAREPEEVISEERIPEGAGRDEADRPGASQPQPAIPQTPEKRSTRSRVRSALRLSPKH